MRTRQTTIKFQPDLFSDDFIELEVEYTRWSDRSVGIEPHCEIQSIKFHGKEFRDLTDAEFERVDKALQEAEFY